MPGSFRSLVETARGAFFVARNGGGPPIVLLPGTAANHAFLNLQARAFGEGFEVLRFDPFGVGRSDPMPSGRVATIAEFARDLIALLDGLCIESAHVFGVSLGVPISLSAALLAPARVRSLLLHSGAARSDPEVARESRRLLAIAEGEGLLAYAREAITRNFSVAYRETHRAHLEAVARSYATGAHRPSLDAILAQGRASLDFDLVPSLASIRCPVLVTAGEEDTVIPARLTREIADRIPGATFHLFRGPGASHASCVERAAEFNSLCLDFLSKLGGPAGY
jgi:pimeloyl-ACP methyl ester carboxylesterase